MTTDLDWRVYLALAVALVTLACLVGLVAEGNALAEQVLALVSDTRRMLIANARREMQALAAEQQQQKRSNDG